MSKVLISKKCFTLLDQKDFSDFSGDINPIHLSKEYSRKTPPGEPIVHGINAFLWALECCVASGKPIYQIANVKFLQPIYLEEEVCCFFYPQERKLEVASNDIIFINIFFEEKLLNTKKKSYEKKPKKLEITEHDIQEIVTMKKSNELIDFPYSANSKLVKKLYPNLHKSVGSALICEIACLSSIVGMQLPGLHSIFVSFKINLDHAVNNQHDFIRIIKADERFNIVDLEVISENISSIIRAIVRPKPIENLSIQALETLLEDEEKINKRILVIGGTRGIGNIVVKILSLLGCNLTFTYASGFEEALKLKEDMSKFGKDIDFVKFDINCESSSLLFNCKPEYIFYFPTPKIFVKRTKEFEAELYKKFHFFYVESFKNIFDMSKENNVKGIFYPSSIALEENAKDMIEYVKAKKDGEIICKELNRKSTLKILVKRLPRILTDQTATNLNIKSEGPFDIMMPIIREFLK